MSSSYGDVIPQWASLELNRLLQLETKSKHRELECRLGELDPQTGRFRTGVAETFFDQTLSLVRREGGYDPQLSGYDEKSKKDVWTPSEVLYYDNDVRSTNQQFESCKRVDQLDVLTPRNLNLYDLRFALKEETPLHSSGSYGPVRSRRCKTRQSYVYPHLGFRLDFSIAATISNKKNKQQAPGGNGTKSFEIEMELLRDHGRTAEGVYQQAIRMLGRGRIEGLTPYQRPLPQTANKNDNTTAQSTEPTILKTIPVKAKLSSSRRNLLAPTSAKKRRVL
jgi:mRNA capping enzyme, beta chain